MKKMKKALACLLATLMLLTALPLTGLTAFAAGETTITLNQPASVTVPGDGNYAYAYFTPPTDGVYKIYSTGDEIDPYCHLYNGDYEILSDDDSGEECNFSFYVFLNAGIKYCLKIDSFNEYPGDITVYVTESDIVSVTFRNLTIIYDYDYEYCSDWYGDDWYDYKRQIYEDCIGFTVTKKDGTSLTEEDTYVDITVTDNQGYNNEWKPGNTYTATVTGFGVTATIKVTVAENPIQSVTVTKQPIIEKMEGSWEIDNYYDEELGEYVSSPEYWYYDWEARRPDKIDLHLKDGTIYTLDEDNDYTFCWNGSKYNLSLWSDQSYEDRWDVGKHISYGDIAGFEFEYEVEIVESPIASVKGETVYLRENTEGYWTVDSYYDDEDNWVQTPEYFLYYTSRGDVTITLKDGTEIILPANGDYYFEWNGTIFYLDCWSEQNYTNQWTVGSNTAYGEIGGYVFTYEVVVVQVNAEDLFEYVLTDGGAVITGLLSAPGKLEIPDTLGDYPVVGVSFLGYHWQVKEIVIPDSVKELDEDLFDGLYNVMNVHLGAQVEGLTPAHFQWSYLETITVSADNPYYCAEDNVLYDKDKTKILALAVYSVMNYEVPTTISDISALFLPIYGDISITFASGNKNFVTENKVTYNKDKTQIILVDKSLSGAFTMPNSVEIIGSNAFRGCDKLTEVTVSSNVTEITYGAFAQCTALNKVTLPEGLVSIEMEAFQNTTSLTMITLPEELEYIGYYAFAYSGLTSVKIPDLAYGIGSGAFRNTKLTSLELGENVNWIESMAFAYTDIQSVVLPDSLCDLGNGAFMGCSKLASVTFSKNLTEICNDAFYGTALTELTLPAHIDYVGDWAFAYTKITEVVFENPAIYLGEGAFANCPLKSLNLGTKMTEISDYAFSNTDIKTLTVPDSVTDIMYGAFIGSEQLATIDIPSDLVEMGARVFDGTAWYEAQPEGIVYLEHILYGYKGEMPANAQLAIKDGIKVIADYAFANDDDEQNNLREIYIPASVTSIGRKLFGWNEDLTITGVAGSYAQEYAEQNGYTFVAKTLNGWVKSGNDWTYYKNNSMVINQWLEDGGKWYYLDQNGYMVADGFAKDAQGLVYLEKDGVMSTASGWVKSNGKWYYLNTGYALVNKWYKDSKGWVYLGADGAMTVNGWAKDGSKWCYLDQNGYITKNAWIKDNGKWYYLDQNGYMVTNAWKKDSVGWVYVGKDGAMLTNAWCMDSKGWCYVGADGYAVTNCWKKDSIGWIWLDASGSMTKSQWVKDGGKWYYLDQNGYMVTNAWKKDSIGWVYVGANGAMLTNAWCTDSKGWCYVGADGYAVTNCWKKDSIGWIWLDNNGSMTKSQWVKDGGKWYYLDANGYMVADKTLTIGGEKYTFDASGVWVG